MSTANKIGRGYAKFMLYFWLFVAILIFLVVTYMAITEGFKKWSFHYVFALIAFLSFIVRRWMMRRMERTVAEIEERKSSQNE